MSEYIIEVIKILPSITLLLFIIILYFKYSKPLDRLINKFSRANLKQIELFGTKLDFIFNLNLDNISKRPFNLPYNSYALAKRLEFIINQNVEINVLWIEDQKIKIIAQMNRLSNIGMNFEHVETSEKALKLLKKNTNKYQLIISDISRNDNPNEGFDFLKQLVEKHNIIIPTIFYTGAYDYSKGLPPYALGIACMPYELLCMCLDILERNIKEETD